MNLFKGVFQSVVFQYAHIRSFFFWNLVHFFCRQFHFAVPTSPSGIIVTQLRATPISP